MFAPANSAHFALSIPSVHNDFRILAFDDTEAISALYILRIELVSESPGFDLEGLFSQPVFLQFGLDGEGIHGHIEDVYMSGASRRLARYHLTLVSVLHCLQFSFNQRTFQHLTIPQIITQMLASYSIQPDVYIFNVHTSPEREYYTQYGESDFGFIQRLYAEDGITWHHQHSAKSHLLVFTEDQAWFPLLGYTPYHQDTGTVADHPVVNRLSQRFSSRTSEVTRRGYDLKRSGLLLGSQFTAELEPALEDYRYPSPITTLERGQMLARQALERHRVGYQLAEGQSDQPTLHSGRFFKLTEHPRKTCNKLQLLLGVTHFGRQPQSLEESVTGDNQAEDRFTQGYRGTFAAIPWDVFFRSPLLTHRPPPGCQTVRVTGPADGEIFCDKYGRMKVKLHWDRQKLRSDRSNYWLRVTSNWTGEHFGAVTTPRVGMGVVVSSLGGNPDRPLTTGVMPNKAMLVPHALPANKSRTVLRNRSTPNSGGYNELSIENRAGQEKIFLRAQRDIEQLILNDSRTNIGNNRHKRISQDNRNLAENDHFEQVNMNNSSLIKGGELHVTQDEHHIRIGGNELLPIDGTGSIAVDGTWVVQARSQTRITAINVLVDADVNLTLKASGQHIVINSTEIFNDVPIVRGGAPMAGIAPQQALQALVEAAQAVAASSLPLVTAIRQRAADFYPLCEICRDRLCRVGGAA